LDLEVYSKIALSANQMITKSANYATNTIILMPISDADKWISATKLK
jgi:hypothetical protein